ncbi:MAG TPA: anti-sigma F factor antagonist [Bacillota bacterium]|jgi:stage II sporulation protein AA (anti-sigma F factor antagonist)
MKIEQEVRGRTLIIRLGGELDVKTAPEFRETTEAALERHAPNHLLINLDGVSFIDSTGLGAILGRYRRIQQGGGRMSLVAPSPNVRRVMELSGIFKIMPAYRSEERALEG